jgi:hypothetical protein
MLKRQDYIPTGARLITREGLTAEVYTSTNANGKPSLLAFRGKAQKPSMRYYYGNEEQRQISIDRFFDGLKGDSRYDQNKIDEVKQARQAMAENTKVGDLFYSSWGYEQTNIDFYKVLARSGMRFTLIEVAGTVERTDSCGNDHVVADPNLETGESFHKIINEHGFSLTSYSNARPWAGDPMYQTGINNGH